MFWQLWNYLSGYVIIRITGFSAERFINLALISGVRMWDIKYAGNERIMKVALKSLEIFRECAEKSGCKAEIIKKCGMPFILKDLFKRRGFSAGIVFFLIIVFAMTRFIWVVETEGNERVSTEKLLEFCKENGVAAGRLKDKTDLKALGQKIILNFDDVAWAAVNKKGTKIVVSVAETIKKPEKETSTKYCTDIVAEKDGIIESILTEGGTAFAQAGDVVEKGDMLIKGEVILKDGETETARKYESAKGKVMAKTVYSFNTQIPLSKKEKKPTGESKYYYRFFCGKKAFEFFKPDEENDFESVPEKKFTFGMGDFKLPFGAEKMRAEYFEENIHSLTEKEVLKELQKAIDEKKEEILKDDAYVFDEKTVTSSDEKFLNAETELLVIENIGKQIQTNNIQGEFVTNGITGNDNNGSNR